MGKVRIVIISSPARMSLSREQHGVRPLRGVDFSRRDGIVPREIPTLSARRPFPLAAPLLLAFALPFRPGGRLGRRPPRWPRLRHRRRAWPGSTIFPATSRREPDASRQPRSAPSPRTLLLDNGKHQIQFTLNGRLAVIDGVNQWLGFPVTADGDKLIISRLDLSKIIEPSLRPELITGLNPVNTVVLDPGHGGHDKGAVCIFGNEKDFALDVCFRARKLLEAEGPQGRHDPLR